MTKIQKAILDVMRSSKQHLTATEVYTIIQQAFPSIALGTVYRNLNIFSDSKVIRRVARLEATDYYEGNIKPHDHSLCAYCGMITDINIPGMKDYIKSKISGRVVSFDLVVNIVCQECLKTDANSLET